MRVSFRGCAFALMVLIGVLPGSLSAQEGGVSGLAGTVEIPRLLDLSAQRLGITLEYDAAALRGSTTIRVEGTLSDEELWSLANRALAARGFTTVAADGDRVLSVVKLSDAPGLVAPAPPEELDPYAGYVATVFIPRHRTAKELSESVAKLADAPGAIVSLLDEQSLLLSDLRPRLERRLSLLRTLDTPQRVVGLTEVPLRSLAAVDAMAAIAQIAAKRELLTGQKLPGEVIASPGGRSLLILAPDSRVEEWRSLISSLDDGPAVESATYTPGRFPASMVGDLVERLLEPEADPRWRLVIDELTGSLIVTATESQHEQIRSLIDRLSVSETAPDRPVRTFVIRNRKASEILDVLERLLAAGVLDPAAGSPEQPPTAVKFPPPPEPSSNDLKPSFFSGPDASPVRKDLPVTFTVDEATSTLIAIGDPLILAQVEVLLRQLDVRQPQVMLEVLMVSLSESQTLDLGVELEQIQISNNVRIRLSSLFGLGTRRVGADLPAGTGFTGVVLSPGDFSVVVRALQTVNRGRSLSMPKLLVANNQEAVLNSVLEQPYASINATEGLSTTSFGGSKPAGTQISIKPQISEGDSLILSYQVSLSAFVGARISDEVPPPRQENNIQSVATIPDGYTVVVGGIELASDSKGTNQVPGIGNIPVLGELFKTRSNNGSRSRFYVFIRANVLRESGFEDLKYISDRDVANAGVDDGWPLVEPRIIR